MSKIAFIFPGQGAQKAGMGKDFYENSKTAAEVIDRASELLGLDMKKHSVLKKMIFWIRQNIHRQHL